MLQTESVEFESRKGLMKNNLDCENIGSSDPWKKTNDQDISASVASTLTNCHSSLIPCHATVFPTACSQTHGVRADLQGVGDGASPFK